MKTKQLIISTIFTLIASYPVSSETENFDMALSGDFQNDYCTFSISDNDLSLDLDTTSDQMKDLYGVDYFEVNWGVITLYCADGSYTVTASFPEESTVHDNVRTLNYVNMSLTPSYHRYVAYEFTRTYSVQDGIWGYIYPSVYLTSLDNSAEALPESYNILLPLTIQIDAL